MAKEEVNFEQFLAVVEPPYQNFISELHKNLIDNGCKAKIESKSSGLFVSYTYAKSKKSIVNLLFRKKGLIVRIYGEHANVYNEFMNTLPEEMIKAVEKAPVCKRLIDPDDCTPKCSTGYDFTIGNAHFQKCKYNCFMFAVNDKNNPYIKSFVENELIERDKCL